MSALQVMQGVHGLLYALFDGICLGLLDRHTLHSLDEYCYKSWGEYHDETYNRSGLTNWEQNAIETYFQNARRLLVAGAGGGREILALCKLGYEVDGFECHPELAAFANTLLKEEGVQGKVTVVPRDECIDTVACYDGLIVGWGAYMLIQGRKRRIAFLNKLRHRVKPQAPLLISFFHRTQGQRRFRVIAVVGTALRYLLLRNPIEVGDSLAPNYVHHFTEEEIDQELREAGFRRVFYDTQYYGHAVGIASTTCSAKEKASADQGGAR